jgi:hypothetical protein
VEEVAGQQPVCLRAQEPDLLELSLRLARTPGGPLYRSHISPDREITAYVTEHTH